jgi:hypothetical protein
MPPTGSEPAIPASEQQQTHALDRKATGIGIQTFSEKFEVRKFYVLLTVHLGIILVNDKLDAEFFFLICLFQSSTCFEQPRAHHQEINFFNTTSGIYDGHLHRVTYTRSCIDTIDSPDDEHEVARNT